jgi:hypothetical protein
MRDTLDFGRCVSAKRMLLFHHDPLHADDFLDSFHSTARQRWAELGGDPTEIDMGIEGGEVEVSGGRAAGDTVATGLPA